MSGFVPNFENDLFISYAHADDRWTKAFVKSLCEELSHRLGFAVSVWQDAHRLRVGQDWPDEIRTGVQRSAVFVAVLSPSYKNSMWCTRERSVFRQLFASKDEFEKSNRFIKVLISPWEGDGHEDFLPAIEYQKFFTREGGLAGDIEFVPRSSNFRHSIGVLANAIAQTLRQLRRQRERVFVASPAEDCLEVWNQLCEELRSQGYDVQPEGLRGEEFSDKLIRSELEDAQLSVHLLGAGYYPFAHKQIDLAVDLDRRLMFWLSPVADSTADANQARLIEALINGLHPDHPEIALPPGWTLLRDRAPRRLIGYVLDSLKPKQPEAEQPSANGGVSRVYIVHDATTQEENQIAAKLQGQIVEQEGLKVFLSRADLPSAAALQQRHKELMQTCEGVLLCCSSAAPQEWLVQAASDVLFAEKLHQRKPFKSRAFLVPDPAQWSHWTNNLQAISSYGPQFSLGDLEPFLAPLRVQGGAAHGI